MSILFKLIERVEKASGPDLVLDAAIACAIFKTIETDEDLIYRVPVRKCDGCAAGTYWHVSRSGRSLHTAPLYTGSIDAALTLLPEGYDWSLFADNGSAMAGCQPASDDGCDMTDVPGATPALALVAACLKARLLELSEAFPTAYERALFSYLRANPEPTNDK